MKSRKRSFVDLALGGVAAILGGVVMSSCASTEGWTETDWELARRGISPTEYATAMKRTRVQQYIEGVLYVGMPEEEFVRLFTKASSTDPDQPYIIEHKDNQYILLEFPSASEKARVTFRNGTLVKLERYGTGSYPWGYADRTYLLKEP